MNIKDEIKQIESEIDKIECGIKAMDCMDLAAVIEVLLGQVIERKDKLLKLKEREKAENVFDSTWRPEPGERFWFISLDGIVKTSLYSRVVDWNRWNATTGNTYQTEAHCKKAIEAAELISEINQFAKVENGEWRVNWINTGATMHGIYICGLGFGYVTSYVNSDYNYTSKLPYFKTEGIAKEAIVKFSTRLLELQAYI